MSSEDSEYVEPNWASWKVALFILLMFAVVFLLIVIGSSGYPLP